MEQGSTEHRRVVEYGGVKFYVEQISPTYTRLVPVDDPHWLVKQLNELCETRAKENGST